MNNTSVSPLILKVDEPRFSCICIYPASLMRTVDGGLPLRHHDLWFIGSINIPWTKHQLPTGSKNIIVTISFIELRSFYRMVLPVISIEHHYRIGDHFRSFRIQFANNQNAVHSAATAGISMYQIYFPVLVPKWRRVDHSFSGFHQYGFAPWSFRISGLYHVDSIIRIAPINIKLSLMKADSRSPYTFPMLRFIEKLFGFLYRQRIIHQRPVYQITGMKYRKSRYAIKTGSRHIEIISCRTYIRIGVVGI